MNRSTRLATPLAALAMLALTAACDDKKDAPAAATDAAAVSTAALATAAASGSAAGDVYEEDFEEEAEKSINASNLEAEVAKMEAELK